MDFLCKVFGGSYEFLWKAIIRPGRDDAYDEEDLGPYKFEIKDNCYKRTDFELINNRGYKLICSFWEPFDEERERINLPCVIYLHGNSSSRCEAFSQVRYLLPKNICLFSFDFCGCGKSEGDYISLGYYEKDDVHCIVEYLFKSKKVSKIGLWGRSMGAVTALMYASEHPSLISALVLDSGFYSLNTLIHELVDKKVNLPNFVIEGILNNIKETVKQKAGFNLDEIEPYLYARKCVAPAFFCHGIDDNFVFSHHCKDLYKDYKGNTKFINLVNGNHNSSRPYELKLKAEEFLSKYLKDDDFENDETIINCNTYHKVIFHNNKFYLNDEFGIDNNPNFYRTFSKLKYNSKDKILNTPQKKIINQNRISTSEARQMSNKNASQNMRAYSHNNYSKNDLKVINRKNSFNIKKNTKNININIININNKKLIENDDSNSSSLIIEQSSVVYTENKLKKDTIIKKPRVRSMSVNNLKNKGKNQKRTNNNIISNLNTNPTSINLNILSNLNSNNYKSNIFNLKTNYNDMNDRNINSQVERTFTENYYKKNKNNNMANYFISNSSYFNKYKGIKNQKNADKQNYYTSKRPIDKENNLFRKKSKNNEIKPISLKENKNKLMNRNSSLIKEEEKITINTIDNTILDENEEKIGRNIPH
jgi:fermentation-respiration switch protein FrsA (DUF1100 family)